MTESNNARNKVQDFVQTADGSHDVHHSRYRTLPKNIQKVENDNDVDNVDNINGINNSNDGTMKSTHASTIQIKQLPLPPLPHSTSTTSINFEEEYENSSNFYSSRSSRGEEEHDEDLDARANRLCVGSKDFDIHSPIHSLENSSSSTPSLDDTEVMNKRRLNSNTTANSAMGSHASSHTNSSSISDGFPGGHLIRREVGKLIVEENHILCEQQQQQQQQQVVAEEAREMMHVNETKFKLKQSYLQTEMNEERHKLLLPPQIPLLHPIPSSVNNEEKSEKVIDASDKERDPPNRNQIPYEVTHQNNLHQNSPPPTQSWRFLQNDELPSLNIVIMIVGTHGDVLPFVGFAQFLIRLGHRVRIATHKCHRGLVVSRKIEFYPLAGNPKELSEFMVKTGGTVYGSAMNPKSLASNTRMVKEIIKSTWEACTEMDPNDVEETPFVVDAIVSNPAPMGHIHVAEALGVPLHIMFPQPWYYGTKDLAHPMLYNVTSEGALESRINSKKKSYAAWEIIQYQIFGKTINKWRMRTLKLPRIRGSLMRHSIPKEKIPFSAMWSESLLPRPQDWPEQCRVVGTCRFNQNNRKEKAFDPIKAGLQDLIQWLEYGPKPIFIGFGSMVIEHPEKLAHMIIMAAAKVQCRIIVQSGWTNIDVSSCVNGEDLPWMSESSTHFRGPLCFNVGSCPHDWLLPHCCAVIHHGGAGTTAAGLAHGLPTFICPFFGDQFMWAETVHRAGVGPKYCPVKDLEEDILVQALKELNDPTVKLNAEKMATSMAKENGIQGALDHFMNFLPVDNMFCDVSMLMGEVRRARYFLPGSDLKVSVEVAALIEMSKDKFTFPMLQWLTEIGAFKMRRYAVTKYSLSGGIHNICDGLYYGIVGLCFQMVVQAPYKLFHLPDKYAFRCGAFGFCFGCLIGPLGMFFKMLYALLYFVDCVTLGIVNGCSSPKNQREYICNRFHKDNSYVYRLANVEREREQIERDGIHEQRFLVLLNAFEVAVEAQRIFTLSDPRENDTLKIFEVEADDLRINVDQMSFQNNGNKQKLEFALSRLSGKSVSFSQFCKLLHSIVGDEIKSLPIASKADKKKVKLEYWDVYGNYRTNDQISQRESNKPVVRIPVVGPEVKGARGFDVSKQQEESKEVLPKKSLALSLLSSPRNLTEPISRFLGERGRTSSFESVPISTAVRRLRMRSWSDGLANKMDELESTVAGGRVRSNSPKARAKNVTPSDRLVRLRTFSDGFAQQTRKANDSDIADVV